MQTDVNNLNFIRKRRLLSGERGTAFVESALVATFVLIPLLIGAIDFGRAYYVGIEVANSTRAAVQYGSQSQAQLQDTTNQQQVAKDEAPDVSTTCGGHAACWQAGYPLAQWGCECSSQSSATSLAGESSTSCSCPSGHMVYWALVTAKVTYTPWFNAFGLFPPITLNSEARMRYGLQ